MYSGTGRGYNDIPGPPGPPGPPGHISVNDIISLLQSKCFKQVKRVLYTKCLFNEVFC